MFIVWNYKQANTFFIQSVINESNWENAFTNIKTNQKAEIFNEIVLNTFGNCSPSKTIIYSDKDPPWLMDRIRILVVKKMLSSKVLNKIKFANVDI